ncbi:hypothetical protein VNO77_16092 [Canavalia gladiata]|uniref:C2H2-type domain-containing protein n=1 Tax=Canavalia gladiata TaxID=3824 RepID=A0AAN9M587_CANGL
MSSSLTLHNLDIHKSNNMKVQEELLVASKDHTQMIIKGKRTKRQRLPSPLRVAMPSTSINGSKINNSTGLDTATTSPTTIVDQLRDRIEEEDQDMANCLILLAQGHHHHHHQVSTPTPHYNNNKSSLYLYQCKTCNRCFPSFQALGGHRASYKKPKQNGSFTEEKQVVTTFVKEEVDHNNDPTTTSTTLSLQISNRANLCSTNNIASTTSTTKAKVHECSICGAEFSSGQALGGHMRRHRTSVNTSTTTTSISYANIAIASSTHESQEPKKPLNLDLNLPAPKDDHRESKFSFQPRENVIVFSTSSLVDCHY